MKKTKPVPPPPPPKLAVEMPPWLNDVDAKFEFRRVVAILGQNVKPEDQSLLGDYAMAHANVLDLRRCCLGAQRILLGAKGGAFTNPIFQQLAGAESHLATLRRDLFFTPKSRGEKKKTQLKAKSLIDRINEPS